MTGEEFVMTARQEQEDSGSDEMEMKKGGDMFTEMCYSPYFRAWYHGSSVTWQLI
jgi:hypothetical protein